MADIKNLRGSIVAIVTPFTEKKEIDYPALEKLVELHIESGTNAILVCGTTGETPTLSDKEYPEIIKFVVDRVGGRLPVIAGSGGNATDKVIKTSQIAQEQGVDGLLVVSPYYNKPTANGLKIHFKKVAENVDKPIILYNVPGRTGGNISANVTLHLAREVENIVAVKEASGNLAQIMEILRDKPADFKLYSGDDALAYPLIALGADGCISVAANSIPKEFSQMVNAALVGEWETAKQLHYKYLRLMKLNFIEANPIPVKTTLAFMKMIKEEFRLPLCKFGCSTNKNLLIGELSKLGII